HGRICCWMTAVVGVGLDLVRDIPAAAGEELNSLCRHRNRQSRARQERRNQNVPHDPYLPTLTRNCGLPKVVAVRLNGGTIPLPASRNQIVKHVLHSGYGLSRFETDSLFMCPCVVG